MDPKRWKAFDPVLMVGLALSVGLAVVFYRYPYIEPALGVFAGLLGMILTVQVQFMVRERHRAEFETRLGSVVARLEKHPWLADIVEKVTVSAQNVQDVYGSTPAAGVGRQILTDAAGKLGELEAGHFYSPWDDNSIALDLVHNTQHEMLVTSMPAIDLDWWHTPEGQRYWALQREALARDVAVRRVFIYDEWSEALDAIAQEQQRAGVEVRRVHRDDLPTNLVGIMGIWDDSCGHELEYTPTGDAVNFAFLVARPDLERLRRKFDRIERMAVPLDDANHGAKVPDRD